MSPRRLSALLVQVLLTAACSHPLVIQGEGDIVSSTGKNDCRLEDQPCANLVAGDYHVTYSAQPRAGWRFVAWEGSGCTNKFPDCTFNLPASVVDQHWFQTGPPLIAKFAKDVPNILLILADDLSHDHYGFAGHPQLQTPAIDALAAQSVRYPYTYVSSTCRPTMATLLTGLPEHVHGVDYIEGPQLAAYTTIAERLVSAGYTSLRAGKFWEGSATNRGFTDYVPFTPTGVGDLSIGRTSIQPLLDLIDQHSSPWFVWFSPYMPHSPHSAPQEYVDLYAGLGLDQAVVDYYAMITWFDDVVGELLQSVPEDTVVVYLADNGYVQSSIPELYVPESKASSYEHGIRTQMMIRHPEFPAEVRNELASAVDVVTTVLAVADAVYDDLPGRNVLAPAPSEPRAFGSRSTLYQPESGVLIERWMRRGDWKLVDVESGEDRLFNLDADPGEDNNLADDPGWSVLRGELQAELEAWWVESL